MEVVISEILEEIKSRTSNSDFIYIRNFIDVKLYDYKIEKKETGLVKYEMSENERWTQMFFIAKKLQGLTDRSLTYYRTILEQVLPVINKPYKLITSDDIRYYLACYQIKNNVSQTTIDNVRRVLNSFFQWLEDEEYIVKSPTKKIKKTKCEKLLKPPYSFEEIEILKMGSNDKREIALVEFLLSTGARVEETTKLKISDINFENGEVKVYGKGRKERVTYLNASAKIRLKEYLEARDDSSIGVFVSSKKPNRNLTVAAIQSILRKLGQKTNVVDVHPHRFRRTFATIASRRGMPIEEVQKILGHEDLRTTQRYITVDTRDVKKSHDKFMN